MSEHTKGPWEVTQEISVVSRGELSKAGNKANIATCWPHTWLGEKDSANRMRANARLISAAPEMLAELEADEDAAQLSSVDFFEKYGYNVSERSERRRAVIAKAKGESV